MKSPAALINEQASASRFTDVGKITENVLGNTGLRSKFERGSLLKSPNISEFSSHHHEPAHHHVADKDSLTRQRKPLAREFQKVLPQKGGSLRHDAS